MTFQGDMSSRKVFKNIFNGRKRNFSIEFPHWWHCNKFVLKLNTYNINSILLVLFKLNELYTNNRLQQRVSQKNEDIFKELEMSPILDYFD